MTDTGDIMAGDELYQDARDEVIEYLSTQYSRDVIDETEFERRVDQANGAQQINALISVVLDLPDSQGLINRITAPALRRGGAAPGQPDTAGRSLEPSRLEPGTTRSVVAIFAGSDLTGEWDVPETVNSLSVFGGARIDLRDAHLPPGDTHIHALSVFGGTDVIVPEGVNVEVRGIGIFGGFSRPRRSRRFDNAPRVIVDGLAFFGGVDVHVRGPRGGRSRDDRDRD
jgi:hypothetical protein